MPRKPWTEKLFVKPELTPERKYTGNVILDVRDGTNAERSKQRLIISARHAALGGEAQVGLAGIIAFAVWQVIKTPFKMLGYYFYQVAVTVMNKISKKQRRSFTYLFVNSREGWPRVTRTTDPDPSEELGRRLNLIEEIVLRNLDDKDKDERPVEGDSESKD